MRVCVRMRLLGPFAQRLCYSCVTACMRARQSFAEGVQLRMHTCTSKNACAHTRTHAQSYVQGSRRGTGPACGRAPVARGHTCGRRMRICARAYACMAQRFWLALESSQDADPLGRIVSRVLKMVTVRTSAAAGLLACMVVYTAVLVFVFTLWLQAAAPTIQSKVVYS